MKWQTLLQRADVSRFTRALTSCRHTLLGLLIYAAAYLAGEWIKTRFGLIIPGNIIGLFLVLGLLLTGALRLAWVEDAAAWLLWLLPMLFLPIFVSTAADKAFWRTDGLRLFAAAFFGVLVLWAAVGQVAQRLLRHMDESEGDAP